MAKAASAGRARALSAIGTFERFDRRQMLPAMLGATILFLIGSFANFLPQAGVSLFEPAALSGMALLGVTGAILATILTAGGPIGQAVLLGLLTYFIAELHVPAVDSVVAFPLGIAAGFWKPRALARLTGAIFGVVLIGALLTPRAAAFDAAPIGSPGDASLPPLLHLILDEVGPEPLLTGDQFSQWSNAHSRYHVTKASLPEQTDTFYELLQERGYDLEVWRNDYVPSCPEGARCSRYRNFHFDEVRGEAMPLLRKAQLLIYGWLRTGERLEITFDPIDPMIGASHVSPLTSLAVLDRARARIDRLQPGEALSFHVLLPHYPYALDALCGLKPYRDWVGRNPVFPLEARRSAYAEQVTCVASQLASLGRENVVMVIHGDHGTRYFDIEASQTDRPKRDELFRQAFATIFALHLPGVPPQHVDRSASVSSLLEELAASDFTTLPEGRDESSYTGLGPFREVTR